MLSTLLPGLLILSILCSAFAWDLKGNVQWNAICPDYKSIGRAKVILDDGRMYGSITKGGGFVIPAVPEGTYILSVLAHDHAFDQVRIDVFNTSSLPEVRPYILGTPLSLTYTVTLPYPLKLHPRQKHEYFVARQSFDVFGILQSPMVLMMIGVGSMALLVPYLMKNLDPEAVKEVTGQQARIQDLQSSLAGGDFKRLSSMLSDDNPKSKDVVSSGVASTSNTKHRSGKKRR